MHQKDFLELTYLTMIPSQAYTFKMAIPAKPAKKFDTKSNYNQNKRGPKVSIEIRFVPISHSSVFPCNFILSNLKFSRFFSNTGHL